MRSDYAAIGLQGMRGLRLHAATVRGFGALLQADSKRRNHHPHQEDGHRRALKRDSQHGHSLPRQGPFSVIHVTGIDQAVLKLGRNPAF